MKSFGAAFLRPDALPGVNHMRGMQYQIVLNMTFWPELSTNTVVQICVYNTSNLLFNLYCLHVMLSSFPNGK